MNEPREPAPCKDDQIVDDRRETSLKGEQESPLKFTEDGGWEVPEDKVIKLTPEDMEFLKTKAWWGTRR